MHTLFASLAMEATHVGAGFVQGTGSALIQLEALVSEPAALLSTASAPFRDWLNSFHRAVIDNNG